MDVFSKKMQKQKARMEAVWEMSACAEHFDLIVLMTLHDEEHYGAKKLKRFFRAFTAKYDEYKRRYLAMDDTTVCGDRTDTYALKQHLKQIGFDYDAECDAIRKEEEQKKEDRALNDG